MPSLTGALALGGAGLTALVAGRSGMVQFPGYDGSILMNAAWQLHLGYRMYDGVVSGFPPLFLLGAKWSFDLFGVQWSSLVIMNAAFTAVTFVAMVVLLRRMRLRPVLCLLLPAALQATTTLTIGFWWYNQTTAVAACLFLMAAVLFVKDPGDRVGAVALVGTAAVLALCKPNVAFPALAGVAAVCAASSRLRRRGLALLALAAAADIAFLLLAGIDVPAMVSSYLTSGTRALEPRTWRLFVFENDAFEADRTFLLLSLTLASGAAALFSSVGRRPWAASPGATGLAVALLGLPLAVVGMATNNDYNAVDASMAFAGLALVVALLTPAGPGARAPLVGLSRILLLVGLALFLATGASDARGRVRVKSAGPGLFYEDAPLARLSEPLPFRGLRAGPRLQAVIADLRRALPADRGTLSREGVFLGPRIDFAYAAFGIRPAPGMPLYWEPFKEDGRGQTDVMVDRFERAGFAVCVFLTDDYTFLPKRLRDDIAARYQPHQQGQLTVWTRRAAAS